MYKSKNAAKILKSSNLLCLVLFGILFFIGCKKTQMSSNTIDWEKKNLEIANKVKLDLKNLKAILPSTFSRISESEISLDNIKINEYYGLSNLKNVSTKTTKPRL